MIPTWWDDKMFKTSRLLARQQVLIDQILFINLVIVSE